MKRRRHRKKNWDRHFYIQACSYIQTCLTHTTVFYTKTASHTHTLLHTYVIRTNTFTHRVAFTHKAILDTQFFFDTHAQTPLHINRLILYTQTHLYAQSPFAHKHFYTQTLLHTNAFYTQTRLHANTLAEGRCSGLAAHMILTWLSLGQCCEYVNVWGCEDATWRCIADLHFRKNPRSNALGNKISICGWLSH